jgi:hypothetical protein
VDSSHTGTLPKHEEEDDESDVDLIMFDSEDDESSDWMIVATTLKK